MTSFFNQTAVISFMVWESALVGTESCYNGRGAACIPRRRTTALQPVSQPTAFHRAVLPNPPPLKQTLSVHLAHWSCEHASSQPPTLLHSSIAEGEWEVTSAASLAPAFSTDDKLVLTVYHDKANQNSPTIHGLNQTVA